MMKLAVDSGLAQWIEPCVAFVRQSATLCGLEDGACAQLTQAVERACRNVLEHAYEPGEAVRYQIEFRQEGHAVVVGVHDQGLPFEVVQLHAGMRDLVDGVRLVNLGRAGKCVELVKNLHQVAPEVFAGEVRVAAEVAVSGGPVQVRPATAADAVPIARCVYRCYGDTYGSDYLYVPEKLRALWDSGLVTSVVACAADGEVVGHLCYWVDAAADPVGESTDAVVDPRYRGQHLFDHLKKALVDEIRAQGRLGMVSEAVTVHPYSQKGVMASGAVETGLMLGDLPATLDFKGIEDSLPARQSCMLCYLRLNPEPRRTIYLPLRHRAMLEKTVSRVGLDRELKDAHATLEGEGRLEVHLDSGWAEAALRVVTYGADLAPLIGGHLRHLLSNGIPYIYAELPLSDPAAGALSEQLEGMGFSFAGLVPELAGGDVLRMHFLTNLELDLKITVVSDWGAEVRDYVLAQAGLHGAAVSPA